jgi:rhodanese-related sulfurtransferase
MGLIMIAMLLQRALVLGCVGLLAGGVHSAMREPVATKSEKDAALRALVAEATTTPRAAIADAALAESGDGAGAKASGQASAQAGGSDTRASTGSAKTSSATAKPATNNEAKPDKALGLEISIADAKRLFDGGALFVDARRREEYLESHVEGAFLLPADIFAAPQPPAALSMMDPGATLVIYCGGGACDASHNTAFALAQRGFKVMHIMTDGLPAWSAAGYPVSSGAPFYEVGGGS